jgi:hypothetical protein
MNRGKAGLAALLLTGGLTVIATPASAQLYPSCPPGYYFAPAYGLCFPAGYAYDPGYYDSQGYYLYYPYISGFVSAAPAAPSPSQPRPPATRFTTGVGPFTTGAIGPFTTSPGAPAPTNSAPTMPRRR